MGAEVEARQFSREDRKRYREKVHMDLDVLARMLTESHFDFERPMAGLEIELNLVDSDGEPAMRNAEVLAAIADPSFQTELGRFNIEINVAPRRLAEAGFTSFEQSVRKALNDADPRAQAIGTRLVMIGILPTLMPEHVTLASVSENPRYSLLDQQIFAARGEDLEIVDRRGRAAADDLRHDHARGGLHLDPGPSPGQPGRLRRLLERRAGDRRHSGGGRGELAVPVRSRTWSPSRGSRCSSRARTLAARSSRPRAFAHGCGSASGGSPRSSTSSRRIRATSRPCCRSPPTRTRWPCWTVAGCPELDELRAAQRHGLPLEPPGLRHPSTASRTCGWRTESCRPGRRWSTPWPTRRSSPGWCGRWPTTTGRSGRRCRSRRRPRTSSPASRHGIAAEVYWPRVGQVQVAELVVRKLLPLAAEGLRLWEVDEAEIGRLLDIIERRCLRRPTAPPGRVPRWTARGGR